MAWAKNGTPDTLTGAGDTLTISDLTAKQFNQFMVHQLDDGGSGIKTTVKIENVSNTDYARRASWDGGADGTTTSQSVLDFGDSNTADKFSIMYVCNISSEEKLIICHTIDRGTAGAANAPNRNEVVAKMDTTTESGQFTQYDVINTVASGSYNTDSNLSALGTD